MTNEIRPYLIQRCEFKTDRTSKPLSDSDIEGFDSLISLDYMGSSEFEWGTIPKALRTLCELSANITTISLPHITDLDNNPLFIISPANICGQVQTIVTKLFTEERPYQLKESSHCYEHTHGGSDYLLHTNLWWDIDHNWMATFGHNHIRQLLIALGKVCIKKDLPNHFIIPDSVMAAANLRVPDSFTLEEKHSRTGDLLHIIDLSDRCTHIATRNVKDITTLPNNHIKVTVFATKTRSDKDLFLDLPLGPKRDYLIKLLQTAATNWHYRNKA